MNPAHADAEEHTTPGSAIDHSTPERRQGNVGPVRDCGHGRETVTEAATTAGVEALEPAVLLDEPAQETVDAVVGEGRGPLAVVGSPFAGRRTVLDHVAARLAATRVHVGPTGPNVAGGVGERLAAHPEATVDRRVLTGPDADDPAGAVSAAIAEGPTVVSGCHHLYTRRVGGFDHLETLMDAVAGAESTVVTGWNRYAWAYLAAVRDLDRTLPDRVEVGALDAAALSERLLARHEDAPAFERDDGSRGLFTRRQVSVAGFDVPLPALDRAALAARRGDHPDARQVVFERLAAVSGGNVGVATALWERARGSEVRPSDVPDVGQPTLDRETAFCLRVILASERVHRSDLTAVVGDNTERALGRLRRSDLVAVDGDWVSLLPAGVPTAVAETERELIL
jgi:hypothetical protein